MLERQWTTTARPWVARLRKLGGAASILLAAGTLSAPATVNAAPASSLAVRLATIEPPQAIDDFQLTDQDGIPFRFSQLRGNPALIFFGFTHCPDVCPSTLAKLALLTDSADMRIRSLPVVMISVDGDRDTPALIKIFLIQLSMHGFGLTGNPSAVRRIAAQFSGVFFKGFPDKPGGPYLVQHTSQIYLVDGRGRLRASFADASVDTMRQATAALLSEIPK